MVLRSLEVIPTILYQRSAKIPRSSATLLSRDDQDHPGSIQEPLELY